MKRLVLAALSLAMVNGTYADAVTFHTPLGLAPPPPAMAQRYVLELEAPGCPDCRGRAAERLSALAGVARAKVDPGTGALRLTLKPGAAVREAVLRRTIESAGARLRGLRAAELSTKDGEKATR